MKFSRQREPIISEVLNSDEHLTADAIYERLKKENPNLSLGTVYRNLTQLSDNGMIGKVSIPGDPVRFDGNLSNHSHLICESCGKIIDIDEKLFNLDFSKLQEEGIQVIGTDILLRGICSECSKVR